MKQYDVTVIGSGPGGYVCAIRCAQLGFKVALVEKYPTLGGTCLNVGCIPSKALLDSSENFHVAVSKFDRQGITISKPRCNLGRMMKSKEEIVGQTNEGIRFLMKKNQIDVFQGMGSLESPGQIKIEGSTERKIACQHTVIATGSKPFALPGVPFDGQRIISSTQALALKKVPDSMIIVGGGAIGLEMGSIYARLGTQVEVVEALPRIVPSMDHDMSSEITKSLQRLGMKFHVSCKVRSIHRVGDKVRIVAADHGGSEIVREVDYCLISIGRVPYTEGLGLDKVGVEQDGRGRIKVDQWLRTNLPDVWAIGDVVPGPMLAHKAEEEGVCVAERIAGQDPKIHYGRIPNVVYTWPEIASVGMTENEVKNVGRSYRVGKFPFMALGRARASMDLDGMVKVIVDDKDEILGMHIVGARAADLIGSGVLALEFRMTAEDIARVSHAHPTYGEAIKEACLDATGKRALHL